MAKANDLNIYKCVTYPLARKSSNMSTGKQKSPHFSGD